MRGFLWLWVVGCGGEGAPPVSAPTPPTSGPGTPVTPGDTQPTGDTHATGLPASERVELTTRDGVTLVGDLLPSPGAPGVCLVHMIPPSNDRSNWPTAFREALRAEGWAVLAFDRRGAGASGGTAEDAYLGPSGKYDVEACVLSLVAAGSPAVAVIGASNGTTSMLDYTVWAPTEGLPSPAAIGFMTGGAYTENQTSMEQLAGVPAVFTTSTAERAWTADQQALGRTEWVFHEYADGDHGTRMFDAAPEVTDDLLSFLRAHL